MPDQKHNLVWNNCLQIIQDIIPPSSFKTWFDPIKAVKFYNSVLTIEVPSHFFREYLEEHFIDLDDGAGTYFLVAGHACLHHALVGLTVRFWRCILHRLGRFQEGLSIGFEFRCCHFFRLRGMSREDGICVPVWQRSLTL